MWAVGVWRVEGSVRTHAAIAEPDGDNALVLYYFSALKPKAQNINAALSERDAARESYSMHHDYTAFDSRGNPLSDPKKTPAHQSEYYYGATSDF